jgi:segregation and condensation protein B
LLFASGRPLPTGVLVTALAHHGSVDSGELEEVLDGIARAFPVDGTRGFELARVAEGWVFRTNRRAEQALSALQGVGDHGRLSQAALEALAIVAYTQPVTRAQISDIRGVNSDSVLQTLLDRDLVAEAGRREGPGAAVLYGTTERFQVVFGLESLAALPALQDFSPAEGEREELRRRLGLGLPE